VQIDGTVIIERMDENERFYVERMPVANILAGKAKHPPPEIRGLINTKKAAQGDTDVDESVLPESEPTPGDYEVKNDGMGFGLLPSEDDLDPFGVHALEEQGVEVREAGTRSRPSGDAFEYKPLPTSPIYATSFKKELEARQQQNEHC
jgi:Las17-binding protein actin regulator